MIHGKPKQFVGLVIAEFQNGFFHHEPVEIVLHILRGDAPECCVKPFLKPVVQGIDVLDMEKSPLDVPAKVCPDYNMFDMVIHCISLVADMAVRTKHGSLRQRSVQAFRDFRLSQSSIATKCHVEVVLPVSCHYDGSLVFGHAFAFCPSATLRGLRFRCRQPLSDLSKNVSSLSVIQENEPPSSCFRERNILCRQSKAVFLLMCNAAEILSRDFCSDIRCMYAFTSPFLWSFCCHVPVYSVKVLPQSLHLKRCVP